MNKGIGYGVGAYIAWGLFPIYFKLLRHVPALQLISHRIFWSCLILGASVLLTRQWTTFRAAIVQPRIILRYVIAAVLIGINWLVFVWAVNANFIIEISLGYFIAPIVNVLLGVFFLRERLRVWQWVCVALVATGVLYLTVMYGTLPWIAMTLAFSFGVYGLVKKTAPLGSLHGLTLETAILLLPAFFYLMYSENVGQGAFLHSGTAIDLLLIGAGILTAIPLLMFASAAQRIPLWQLGLLQYIAPTLQFLLGVVVYHEPFIAAQGWGFGCVWLALIIFGMEGFLTHRRQTAVTTTYQ
ncbi:MAG: EamA family transporter RarD [Gammaproteobacteria bacterium]|nr:EamA family transporter RarD [Gammaproteobacteria bacterium]